MIYQPICLPELPNVLGGNPSFYQSSQGNIYYTAQGTGYPLLMVHGINAGASNAEWRANFIDLSKNFKVYALDLPGFARSSKQPSVYSAQFYIDAITEFIEQVIKRPVCILSSGLSAAYCCNIAFNKPRLVKALALVTPSGIKNNAEAPCATSFTTYGLFTSPVQGDGLYNAFVGGPSIKYFITNFIYSNEKYVTKPLVDYLVLSSHQCPHAKYAPASFVAGLSNINIAPYFGDIYQPLLIIWGALAKLNPVERLHDFLELNERAKSYVFPDSGLVPQYEKAKEFNNLVTNFFLRQPKE